MYTCIHACVHACMHAHMHTCMHQIRSTSIPNPNPPPPPPSRPSPPFAFCQKRHQRELNEERAQVIRLGGEVQLKEREIRRQRQQSEWQKRETGKKAETELRQALKAKVDPKPSTLNPKT